MKNAFYLSLLYIVLYACANPVAPTGGTKDVDAPTVRYISPVNGITNFDGKHIEIALNEYFTFSKSTEKILITPPVEKLPEFKVKGKKLIIEFKEALEPNTTYTINLFGAISDFHEGNVLDNVSYVFSTGAAIDSSSIEGKVVKAFNNESMEKVVVALFNSSDTSILKGSKPHYIAKTNDNGSFVINNIKEGSYKLVAINDKNYNNTFDQLNEDVSLISSEIYVDGNIALVEPIVVFLNEKDNSVNSVKLLNNNKLAFCFDKPVDQIAIHSSEYNELDKAFFNKQKDTLFYYYNTNANAIDFYVSLNQSDYDTMQVSVKKNVIDPKIVFNTSSILWKDSIQIAAPFFIESVDEAKIHLKDSNAVELPFSYKLTEETLTLYYPFKIGNQYALDFDSAALRYFNQAYSQAFHKGFLKDNPVEASNLILTINNEHAVNAVIELYNKNRLLERKKIDAKQIVFEGLLPGTYQLRVFEDTNQNGVWNTGNFDLQLEPEKTLFYSQPIEIKENWDKELNINF